MISWHLLAAFMQLATGQPSEAELNDRRGDDEVIPAYFHGRWASQLRDCSDPDSKGVIQIGPTRVEGYESEHKLLKVGGVWSARAPNGQPAHYTELLFASSGEGSVFLETLVVSRVSETLYVRAKDGSAELTDSQQYEFPMVRCPGVAGASRL